MKTLFKQNNTGKIQQWTVSVSGNVVTTEYGQVGGKLMTTSDTIKGKNAGKSNETTDEEQAQIKADQLFEAKTKEGYVVDIEAAKETKNSLDGVEPMLAFPIEKKPKAVIFPAYVQPKLDGLRCIAVVTEGKCVLYSRSQKVIPTVPHINLQIELVCEYNDIRNLTLDGELYNHEDKDNFNRIISLVKRDEPHPDCAHMQYHLYDVVAAGTWFSRTKPLEWFDTNNTSPLRQVPYRQVDSQDELNQAFVDYVAEGYEGAMYRSATMPYENKRSTGLLKIKTMQDEEFTIIGVEEGNGKLQGKAGAFVCATDSGLEFKAKMKGKLESLTEYLINFEKYRGKKLTVQYFNLTPFGVPRFPVGLRVREDE